MEFIRTQSSGPKPFQIDYCLIKGYGHHPKALGNLDDGAIEETLEQMYIAETQARLWREDPTPPLMGTGCDLYVGYDAEWTEISPGVLSCESYQFYVVGPGGEMAIIFYPNSGDLDDRLTLVEMLSEVIALALQTGCIVAMPKQLVLAGFVLRSDLAMTADLPAYKRQLSNVSGKIATGIRPVNFEIVHAEKDLRRLMTPKPLTFSWGDAYYLIPTRFVDIGLHAAPRAALSDLGEAQGILKLELPAGYSKSRMDLLKREQFDFFRHYGIRDAEITVRYWLHILNFAREVVGADDVPVSAGALAVQLCRQTFTDEQLDYAALFDVTQVDTIEWNEVTGRKRSKKQWVVGGERAFHEQFAIQGFHGGNNQAMYCGPSEPGYWIDLDLIGAYTTGMVSVRPIAFSGSFETRRLQDFLGDVLGVAWIEFRYPDTVRFPALPVRSAKRGLIFPLTGETYATAPEIALAVRQGCQIIIKRGVIWPWDAGAGDVRIFEAFVRKVRALRKAYAGTPVLEEYAKLLGNSVYGKTAQSLRDRNAFEMSVLASRKIGPSAITNAPIAAHVTGFVRAVLGELLDAIPAHRTLISVTTDGFLTNARADEIDLSGPLCQRYLELCRRVEA